MGDAVPARSAPSGPGENWLRLGGLVLLGGVILLDAFVDGFDPSPTLYVPMIGGAIAGNELWARATRRTQPPGDN